MPLKSRKWLDFWNYLGTFSRQRKAGRMGWKDYFGETLRCRSYALWQMLDPGPACAQMLTKTAMLAGKLARRFKA